MVIARRWIDPYGDGGAQSVPLAGLGAKARYCDELLGVAGHHCTPVLCQHVGVDETENDSDQCENDEWRQAKNQVNVLVIVAAIRRSVQQTILNNGLLRHASVACILISFQRARDTFVDKLIECILP